MLAVCHYSHDWYTILPYISSIFNRIISRKTGLFTETLLPVMSSLAMATRSKWQTLGWWDRYMKMCTAQGSPKNFLWSGWPQNHFIKAFTQPKVMCELTITTSGQGNQIFAMFNYQKFGSGESSQIEVTNSLDVMQQFQWQTISGLYLIARSITVTLTPEKTKSNCMNGLSYLIVLKTDLWSQGTLRDGREEINFFNISFFF